MKEWSSRVHEWVKSYAELHGCTAEEAVSQILESDYDETLGLGRRLALRRVVPPSLWLRRVEALQRIEKREADEAAEKELERDSKRQKYLNSKLKEIDFSVLERDLKTRSGYAGVYAHRERWRAFVVTPGGKGQYLRSRVSPELAAWDRYQWHKANDVPYGEGARSVAAMQRGPAAGTDPEILAAEQEALERWQKGEIGARDMPLVFAERAARKALREAEAGRRRGRPPRRKEIVSPLGGIVTWLDEFRLVVEHSDDSATSYKGISEPVVAKGDRIEDGGILGYALGAKAHIQVASVPPPSKLLRSTGVPTPRFSPASPHYAAQQHFDRLAKEDSSPVGPTLKLVESEPVVEPDRALESEQTPATGDPDIGDQPIEVEISEPSPPALSPPTPAASQPEDQEVPTSIFDPGYRPPELPAPGRFAHLRSVPKPPEQVAIEIAETLATIPEE